MSHIDWEVLAVHFNLTTTFTQNIKAHNQITSQVKIILSKLVKIDLINYLKQLLVLDHKINSVSGDRHPVHSEGGVGPWAGEAASPVKTTHNLKVSVWQDVSLPGLCEKRPDHLLSDNISALSVVHVLVTGELHHWRQALSKHFHAVHEAVHISTRHLIWKASRAFSLLTR